MLTGILSVGIHQLEEQECSAFFPVLKASIIKILSDDKRALEDEEERKSIAQELAKFKAGQSKAD